MHHLANAWILKEHLAESRENLLLAESERINQECLVLLLVTIFDDPAQLDQAYEAEIGAVFAVLEVYADPPWLAKAQHSDYLVQFVLSVDQSDVFVIVEGRFWNFLANTHF